MIKFYHELKEIFKISGIPKKLKNKRKETKLIIFTLLCTSIFFNCYAQVTIPGNRTTWSLVGAVPANTAFNIQASGTVDFGCALGSCKDGVNAGVTGNAFGKWLSENENSIVNAAENIAKAIGYVINLNIKAVPGETYGNTIKRMGNNVDVNNIIVQQIQLFTTKVNYDEGGFWIVMTTNAQPPSQGNNIFTKPVLYYWYNKIYQQLGKEQMPSHLQFTVPLWVWVLPHDGGRDAFNFKTQDYHDNSGSYNVVLKRW